MSNLRDRSNFRICGIIDGVAKKFTKKDGRLWSFFNLDTGWSVLKINCFPDCFEKIGNRIKDGELVVLRGSTRLRDDEISGNATDVCPLASSIQYFITRVDWVVDADSPQLNEFILQLNEFIQNNDGNIENVLTFEFKDGRRELAKLPSALKSSFNQDIIKKFKQSPALKNVTFLAKDLPQAQPSREFRYSVST